MSEAGKTLNIARLAQDANQTHPPFSCDRHWHSSLPSHIDPPPPLSADFDLDSYAYSSPEHLIADRPAMPRDSSRLMILDRSTGRILHEGFRDLPRHLRPGDRLVINRTKVWPARLIGRKSTGGRAEMLLVRELGAGRWAVLSQDLKPGLRVQLPGGGEMRVEGRSPETEWECRFSPEDVRDLMERHGLSPLPPYILKRRKTWAAATPCDDRALYQTIYATEEGSVAAPTAGLHFTERLLEEIRALGVSVLEITLHVGHGTFQPVTSRDVRLHRMKPEWYRIGPEACRILDGCRTTDPPGRLIAVGTTATRSLETWAATSQTEGWTNLFIHPGHAFQRVDALITNFHLPRSTPLLLSCALAGRQRLLAAYREAIQMGYRLYSYGDAMLIL